MEVNTQNKAATKASKRLPKPPWLKVAFPGGKRFSEIKQRAAHLNLSTVCEEARCPNIGECWNGGTATFMLMGDTCTRGCRFCSVQTHKNPPILDSHEPKKLAETISEMDLSYVVLTTVDRDDLPDQGASHIARCIRSVQRKNPELLIEILMPDFCGKEELLQMVIDSKAKVLSHNLETVQSLTSKVRDPRAGYAQSLEVLDYLKKNGSQQYTKSSLMLGLGEDREELLQSMEDLRKVGVDFLTIGQYLRPSHRHLEVQRFLSPDEFKELEVIGLEMGFDYVASAPLVRSSYRAAEFYIEHLTRSEA